MKQFRDTCYFITEDGQVFNGNRKRYLATVISKGGYKKLILRIDKKKHYFTIHRLVAEVYCENIENKKQVNHKDCNKLNNHYTNLEWCNSFENMAHAYKHNLVDIQKGSKNGMSKLNEDIVIEIRNILL